MTELKERLDLLDAKYSNTDKDWVRFIHDHKFYLLDNSIKTTISKADMFNYRYRVEEFVYRNKLDPSATWIVLWLNQLDYKDFVNVSEIWLPSASVLNILKSQYKTNKLKQTKIFDKYSV